MALTKFRAIQWSATQKQFIQVSYIASIQMIDLLYNARPEWGIMPYGRLRRESETQTPTI